MQELRLFLILYNFKLGVCAFFQKKTVTGSNRRKNLVCASKIDH